MPPRVRLRRSPVDFDSSRAKLPSPSSRGTCPSEATGGGVRESQEGFAESALICLKSCRRSKEAAGIAFSDDFGTRCGGGEGGATRRHDYEDSVAKRGALPAAGHQLVAHREGGLHAHHHNRRRHYVEKHVSAKPSQPGRGAQRRRRAAAGRGHDPHGETAKEQRRNHAAERKSNGVVQNPVALEHVPDFGAARLAPRGRFDAVPAIVWRTYYNRLKMATFDRGGFESLRGAVVRALTVGEFSTSRLVCHRCCSMSERSVGGACIGAPSLSPSTKNNRTSKLPPPWANTT